MDEEYLVKDRFQDVLLSAIYNSVQEADTLIFKGGTALRKIYGIDRYSDDLDFTLNDRKAAADTDSYIYDLRNKCIAMLSPMYVARMYVHKNKRGSYQIDANLKDNLANMAKIRIEIKIARVFLPSLEKRVIAPNTTYIASVMAINEMIAEKISAVYTRRNIENMARDMVDIAFLKEHGGKFDLELTNEKLKEDGHKQFTASTFSARTRLLTESVWQRDLNKIMGKVPDRNRIMRQVADFVKRK